MDYTEIKKVLETKFNQVSSEINDFIEDAVNYEDALIWPSEKSKLLDRLEATLSAAL